MKSQLLIIILACFLGTGFSSAQNPNQKKAAVIKAIQANSQLSSAFKEKAIQTYRFRDSILWAKSPQSKKTYKNKALAFEKAIEAGEGKQWLTQKDVTAAKKKFPGNTTKSIGERLGSYILQMERVFDDE